MKKTLISLFVVGIITLFTAGAYAEWKLYDDFDNYDDDIQNMKDSDKWFISQDAEDRANFSIEDGRLKIFKGTTTPAEVVRITQTEGTEVD